VAQDFIARGSRTGGARRAFLLSYCKEKSVNDFETQRALEKDAYLPDDKLLLLQPKIKQPNQTN